MNTQTKIKYFLYARKSSEAEDRQAASIQAQIDELTTIARTLNLEIVEVFEESQSAKAPGRPIFNQMIGRLYTGEADGILCWKLDRLARNFVDGGAVIDLLQSGKLQSIRTHEKFYYPSDNVLIMAMEFGMANQFIRDLSVNVKRGLKNKATQGWRPSGAPIGYLNTPGREKGFKTICRDPERFDVVRRLWDMMLTGNYTVPQIWEFAKNTGLITQRRRNIGGKALSRSAVYQMFTNPFYYGYFEFGGELLQGKHEPMITEKEYDHVQTLLERKGNPRPRNQKNFAFTGSLMRCGSCGSSVTAEIKIKRQKNGNVHEYVYYHCTHRKDASCVERSIELNQLNKQVDEVLSRLEISERFKNWAISNLHTVRSTEAMSNESILVHRNNELESVIEQLDALMLKYTSPANTSGTLISDEEYQSLKSQLVKKKNTLEKALNDQGKEHEQWMELSEKTFNFARYARIWFEKGDDKTRRAILACLGSNLLLKDRKINMELHPVFNSIVIHKDKVESELESARTSKNPYDKRKTDTFVSVCPTGLRE